MQRDQELIKKRREFVENFVAENQDRPLSEVVNELSEERLFISERTIYRDLTAKNRQVSPPSDPIIY